MVKNLKGLLIFSAITLVVFGLFIGCATIMDGTTQIIPINSQPDKANVEVIQIPGMSIAKGVTPLNVELGKDEEYEVKIELAGYQPVSIILQQDFNVMFLGNILCGGPIGMVVDFVTGAMWDLTPEMISIELLRASLDGESDEVYAVCTICDSDGIPHIVHIPLIRS